jgi:hypothetical protein
MRFKSNEFIAVTGKAFSGKTYWIKKHISRIPPGRLKILDYNCNDYGEFSGRSEVFNFNSGNVSDIDMKIYEWYSMGNCYAVLEEADNYLNAQSGITARFVNTGRNRGCGAIVSIKRSKSVKPHYRSRFNKIVAFKNTLVDDIRYLEDWAGSGRGSLDMLRELEQGEYIVIDLDNQEISPVKKIVE